MKKNLVLGLLCIMAAVPVGMHAMEEGAQANASINLSKKTEADINNKAKIMSTAIFGGYYNAACVMYDNSLSNINKYYYYEERTAALIFFNQKIRDILTPVILELIKLDNDKALYAFKRIIDQNGWKDLQNMIANHIINKQRQVYALVGFGDIVAQAIASKDLNTLLEYKENNPFMKEKDKQVIERGIATVKTNNPMLAQQLQAQRNNRYFVPVIIPAPSYLTRAYNYVTTHKKTILTAGLTLGAVGLALYKAKNNMPVFSFWS